MTVHPIAAMFPTLEGEAFKQLCESIQTVGLLEPIVRDGEELIDGRNRLKACEATGVAPQFISWESLKFSGSKGEWILTKNETRRHLTADQRAQIWYEASRWLRQEALKRQKNSQFKPHQGNGDNMSPARAISCEPHRDCKAEHERSTIGQVSKAAKVSTHKVRQAAAVSRAVEEEILPQERLDSVKNGTSKLADVVKQIPKTPHHSKPVEERIRNALSSLISKFTAELSRERVVEIILSELK